MKNIQKPLEVFPEFDNNNNNNNLEKWEKPTLSIISLNETMGGAFNTTTELTNGLLS